MKASLPTVIICPGNGCSNIRQSNWYGDLFRQLDQRNVPCLCENFPDPYRARRDVWVPYIRNLATQATSSGGKEENVVLVGHSSGAQAVLRYTELYACRAAILVSATYSDLGDAGERASGYYPQQRGGTISNPYDFAAMKHNCPIWHQFHSDNDPFIPVVEAEQIRNGLGLTDTTFFHLLPGRSHFFEPFPELLEVIETVVTA